MKTTSKKESLNSSPPKGSRNIKQPEKHDNLPSSSSKGAAGKEKLEDSSSKTHARCKPQEDHPAGYKLSRSVSLTPSSKKKSNYDDSLRYSPSPKPKVSRSPERNDTFRSQREKFEGGKNQSRKNVEELTNHKSKNKKNESQEHNKKQSPETEKEDPIAILLKEIRNNLKDVKIKVNKNIEKGPCTQ